MKRKIRAGSLRLKTWLYFLIFSVIVLTLIWLSQVLLLKSTYLAHKRQDLLLIGKQIEKKQADGDDLLTYIADTSIVYNLNIYIIDTRGNFLMPLELAQHSTKLPQERFEQMKVRLNGKSSTIYHQSIAKSSFLIYASATNGEYIYISAPLESVTQTVNLLRFQLFYITVLVILISFILAFIFSSDLSKPVLQMSRSAKKLAKRDFSATFEGSPYYEINELAQTLNYAKNELLQADEQQKSLIANISHDLKTPLTMIKAYAEMIRDISGEDKQKREKCTEIIIDEADRLTLLVNDILNVSRAGSKLTNLKKQRENISELVKAVSEKFQATYLISGYDIQSDITDSLFSVIDRESIIQAVYNLVANAVNYTGEDKLVKISLNRFGDLARFEVKDTGNGISKQQQKHIWDRYHRYAKTHKRPVAGSGLGLSIVKSILTAHGFNFGVVSTVNKGSCFYIDFPLYNEKN